MRVLFRYRIGRRAAARQIYFLGSNNRVKDFWKRRRMPFAAIGVRTNWLALLFIPGDRKSEGLGQTVSIIVVALDWWSRCPWDNDLDCRYLRLGQSIVW